MTYDFHGSWERNTGENSPLYKGPADTGDYIYFNVVSVFLKSLYGVILLPPGPSTD